MKTLLLSLERKIVVISAILAAFSLNAGVWQWTAPVEEFTSSEVNGNHPTAFLWIPEKCDTVKAVMVGQHNMNEETLFEMPSFREKMAELGVALVWISPIINFQGDLDKPFQRTLDRLAEASGYSELSEVPVIPIGHSAMATFPWNYAAWNPDKTLCIISYHGDAPRTNLCGYGGSNVEWGRNRNINGIPGLMIEGEYEWWEDRVNPARGFRLWYPQSCISFLCDAGRGHFDVSEQVADYIAMFVKKSLEYRGSDLRKIDPADGWLAQRWTGDGVARVAPAKVSEYTGDPHDAFWYFDEEIADLTEKIYASSLNKKPRYLGFMQNGEVLNYNPEVHAGTFGRFKPEADGLTIKIKGVVTDSLRQKALDGGKAVKLTRINGPVKVLNDSTIKIDFYYMGTENLRRVGAIWLVAETEPDATHKGAVQQININIPYPIENGEAQTIYFPEIKMPKNLKKGVELTALSSSGLPVGFYVKEGPAEIRDGRLYLTAIPPRSKRPVKITVVAWQYGKDGLFKTAAPAEQTIYVK